METNIYGTIDSIDYVFYSNNVQEFRTFQDTWTRILDNSQRKALIECVDDIKAFVLAGLKDLHLPTDNDIAKVKQLYQSNTFVNQDPKLILDLIVKENIQYLTPYVIHDCLDVLKATSTDNQELFWNTIQCSKANTQLNNILGNNVYVWYEYVTYMDMLDSNIQKIWLNAPLSIQQNAQVHNVFYTRFIKCASNMYAYKRNTLKNVMDKMKNPEWRLLQCIANNDKVNVQSFITLTYDYVSEPIRAHYRSLYQQKLYEFAQKHNTVQEKIPLDMNGPTSSVWDRYFLQGNTIGLSTANTAIVILGTQSYDSLHIENTKPLELDL